MGGSYDPGVRWGGGHLTPSGQMRGSFDPRYGPLPKGVQNRPRGGCRQPPSAPWGTHPWEHPPGAWAPWALRGWAGPLGVPPRGLCAAGTWARESPVGRSAQRRRPDLPPIGAARGGRALARSPSAAPGRRPGGPCVHEKRFSARPEGKLRLFWSARRGAGGWGVPDVHQGGGWGTDLPRPHNLGKPSFAPRGGQMGEGVI